MADARELRLVLVTPETTLLDEPVDALRFPLYDGQIGILPGRAPLMGRLGFGELRVTTSKGTKSYFLDGGFLQVKGKTVSLLTQRAIESSRLDVAKSEEELSVIQKRLPKTPAEFNQHATDQHRARQKLALARKVR
jgi:F-type H+-transporting ATPase subunit epsilon